MSSGRLQRWLVRHGARDDTRRRSVEDALLSNRFVRYAGRRLVGFALTRLWGTVAHVIELAFLLHIFRFRAQVASLALANLAFLAEAFWWGALEVMRSRLRSETSTAKMQHETSRWLRYATWLGLGAIALPLGVSSWRWGWAHRPVSVLDAYAWLCGVRLAVDLVLRTLFSGVYAKRRVYRPLASLLIADPIGLLVLVACWPLVGPWAFPLGLAITLAVSRGIALYYTLLAYRLLRQPLPRVRLWARAARVPRVDAPSQRGRIVLAGLASVSARLGPVLVLAVLVRSTINNEELGALAFTLHLAGPLLSGTASWSQVFYHDFKRLEDDVSTGLRRHLTRRLGWLALSVGSVLWLLTAAVAFAFAFARGSVPLRELVMLLPLYLALAYLGVLQLRDFARGDFSRMLGAGLVVFAALIALLLGGGLHAGGAGVAAGAALASAIAVLAVLGARERTPPAGALLPSLFAWLGRLRAVRTAVCVGWARVARGASRHGASTAERIAPLLVGRGAITTIRAGRRVLWFEAAPATLGAESLIVAAAGTLSAVQVIAAAPDGARALDRALSSGLLEHGNGIAPEHPRDLVHRFASLFPAGLIVDVARPKGTLDALAPSVRTEIWRDALREARSGRTARQRSGFEVTSYRPGGEIQLLFVAPRKHPLRTRLAWREALEAANWSAAIVPREARERLTALG